MADNKKHHYVPKFYMKFFSEDKKRINVYRLKTKMKLKNIPLKGQCYKNYYYGEDLILEHSLGESEGAWANIFREIIETDTLPNINNPEYFMFIFFTLIQNARTKYSVDALISLIEAMSEEIFEEGIINKEDFIKNELGIENVPQFLISISMESYPFLFSLKCKILKNCTDTEFILSDNPIVFYNHLMSFRTDLNNIGTSSKGLQIFFPISPDTSILFYDEDAYKIGSNSTNVIKIRNNKDIYQINTLQVCSAYDNIYFKNDELNIDALYSKSEQYMRKSKSNIKSFSKEDGKLVMSAIEEVRVKLNLSFLTIRRSAKDWVKDFKKKKRQPLAIYRNEEFKNHYDDFNKQVEYGKYKREDFLIFCKDKNYHFNNDLHRSL